MHACNFYVYMLNKKIHIYRKYWKNEIKKNVVVTLGKCFS